MLARNNYSYQEPSTFSPINGWRKVAITEITEPQPTKNGDATGFWIKLDVRDGNEIVERNAWLSFDHSSEFVITRSQNIGAMLRMMFPHVTNDEGYYGLSFWLLFRVYKDRKTNEPKEQFFDSKHNVSLDGKVSLYGNAIEVQNAPAQDKPVPQTSLATSRTGVDGDEEVPF